MGYMKYTPYLYLVFAGVFVYDAFVKWEMADATPILSLLIAGLAVFMFFFRLKFAKRIEERNKKQ
ncbi:hypothetical protein ACMDB5_02745 [Flavobacterium sp. W1B]|uniref:hypothetical protein n=1 Tax=Flavobacterium sp. W1B TaxID=3394146 RepID=UPI0039BC3DBD